jgi:hypothetical protein
MKKAGAKASEFDDFSLLHPGPVFKLIQAEPPATTTTAKMGDWPMRDNKCSVMLEMFVLWPRKAGGEILTYRQLTG